MAARKYLAPALLVLTVLGMASPDTAAGTYPRDDVIQRLEERLHHLETAMKSRQKRSDDPAPLETVVAQQAQRISTLEAQLQAVQSTLGQQGSTFVHWGRKDCPASTETMYSGYVGGSKYNEQGGASNRLCLTSDPKFDNVGVLGHHPYIRGAEFFIPGHSYTDAPCAVCRTPLPSTVMVPGTNTCPTGWTAQYNGHLTAHDFVGYSAGSEFICLDANPQDLDSSAAHLNDGAFLMHVQAGCGSLPCPPYIQDKVITCVVCSK